MNARRLAITCAVIVASFLVATAPVEARTPAALKPQVNLLVASFDPYVGGPQRFSVGIIDEKRRQLAYGAVTLRFGYAGTQERPRKSVDAGPPSEAAFRPIAGQTIDATKTRPKFVNPSEARGVYGIADASFDRPGIWAVVATGKIGGRGFEQAAAFEVKQTPQVVAIGEAASRTANPLPGTPGIRPKAIDSRATKEGVPDPELHSASLSDVIAAGRPALVVVSTPVYCVSRFCGPITDQVQTLAQQHAGRMAFIHLEVWRDYEKQVVNDDAAQWVAARDGSNLTEPWVFVVDAAGNVVERFDNVVTDQELSDAITRYGS